MRDMLPQQKPPTVVDTPQVVLLQQHLPAGPWEGSAMSEDVRVSITYGDEVSVSRDEFGLPAVKVQSRVWEEPPRWITCDVTGSDRDIYLADLVDAIQRMRRLPVDPDVDGG